MENTEKMYRKSVKKEANRVAVGLLLYSLICFVVIIIHMIGKCILLLIQYPAGDEQERAFQQFMDNYMKNGTSSIMGVVIGVLFLLLFFYKRLPVRELFRDGKRMRSSTFCQLLCVFMGGQMVFSLCGSILEMGLNVIGYSAMESMENASIISETVSMFLYASFVGPIVEEIIYRGFVLRSMQKYGKIPAIIVSAILFGIMHENLPQGIFAFGVGLVLGYVTVEYSIVWAIVLHIINNCIFSDLLGVAVSGLDVQMQAVIMNGICGVFAILGGCILWIKRKQIKQFCVENRTEKRLYCYVFSSIGVIVFVVLKLAVAISELQPL